MCVSVGWMGWSVVDVSKGCVSVGVWSMCLWDACFSWMDGLECSRCVYGMCVSVGGMGWSVVDMSTGCVFQLEGWVGVWLMCLRDVCFSWMDELESG